MFRKVIMGWDHVSTVYVGYAAPKERVEKREIEPKCEQMWERLLN